MGVTQSVFGQDRYNGYVITTDNDTVTGVIEWGSDALRAVRVTFTDYETRKPVELEPFQIKSYCANNQTYDSKVYDVDSGLDYGFAVFMERLESGYVYLYKYWNNKRKRFEFILEGDDKKMTLVKRFRFRKEMSVYFQDHQLLRAKIIRSVYRMKHLKKIVHQYNDWKQKAISESLTKKN